MQLAKELVEPNDEVQPYGVIINGFPLNTNQALLLDRYLRGVNLALHVKSEEPIGDYDSLLKYYDERGALLEIGYKDSLTAE